MSIKNITWHTSSANRYYEMYKIDGFMPTQFFYRKNQNSQRFIFQINQIREALCSSDLQATNVQRGFEPMHCNDNRMKTDINSLMAHTLLVMPFDVLQQAGSHQHPVPCCGG